MRKQPISVNGAKLAETRIRAGMTQADLARSVAVHRSSINRIESGLRSPAPALLVALAAALDVDLDAITDRAAA